MPVYRTGPDITLEDLVEEILGRGERIVGSDRDDYGWTIITEYADKRVIVGKPEKRA